MSDNGEILVIEVPRTRKVMPILGYVASALMGLLYLTNVAEATSLASAADSLGAFLWQMILFLSGVIAFISATPLIRNTEQSLILESVCAGILSIEMLIYVAAIILNGTDWNIPWATVVWVGVVVCGGFGHRSVQAMRDRQRRLTALSLGAQIE